MSLHRANRTCDLLLSKSLWQRWWNVSPALCFVICNFIFADWGEIFLLALKKEADVLWIAHGKCHMIRNHRWPVGVEIRPHWQPVRKWEPQSYRFRRWIAKNLKELGCLSFPSQVPDKTAVPVNPGLPPDGNLKLRNQLCCFYTFDLQKLWNGACVL